jgi:two-component system sensor histidine kinase FlrB
MTCGVEGIGGEAKVLEPCPGGVQATREGDARLLLDAFEMFTQASNSLELAFEQLKSRAQRLSEELAAKNRELKKSLREKEEVQNYLKTILKCLPCGVLVLDEEGRLSLCNPKAAQLLDLRSGRNHKPPRTLRDSALHEYLGSGVHAEADGRETEVSCRGNGGSRVVAASGSPLRDSAGRRIGTLHILRDITELKAMEEQSKLRERLAAMGEMAVELAHEIRNPLGSIELFASLLEKELDEGCDSRRWAENIRIGSRSLNNIVSNMLHFANPVTPEFSMVDVHEIIQEVIGFTDLIMKQRGVIVQRTLDAVNPLIKGDRELLRQLLLNLILNAMQAMPSDGSLTIRSGNVEMPGEGSIAGFLLTIRDTGIGIPPENIGRIFDPFFTTNKSGTGLGLSVVHQIVEKHAGCIQVSSQVNAGTTFTISFPTVRPESLTE